MCIYWRIENILANFILWSISRLAPIWFVIIIECCVFLVVVWYSIYAPEFLSFCWQQQGLLSPAFSRRHFCAPTTYVIKYAYISVKQFCWYWQKLHLCKRFYFVSYGSGHCWGFQPNQNECVSILCKRTADVSSGSIPAHFNCIFNVLGGSFVGTGHFWLNSF